MKKELVCLPIQKKDDRLIVGGAGLFGESDLILDKTKATLLFIELHKFLNL